MGPFVIQMLIARRPQLSLSWNLLQSFRSPRLLERRLFHCHLAYCPESIHRPVATHPNHCHKGPSCRIWALLCLLIRLATALCGAGDVRNPIVSRGALITLGDLPHFTCSIMQMVSGSSNAPRLGRMCCWSSLFRHQQQFSINSSWRWSFQGPNGYRWRSIVCFCN